MGRENDSINCPNCNNWRFVEPGLPKRKEENGQTVSETKCKCTACKHKWIEVQKWFKKEEKMEKNLNEIETTGEVGETYMTETGMHPADPEKHSYGWKQVSTTTRRKVGSDCISGHDPFYVWEFIEQKKPECQKSPTGKHEWKTLKTWDHVRPQKVDWDIVIGTFCIHCGEDKQK